MAETVLSKRDAIDDGVSNPRGDTVVTVNIVLVVIAATLVIARFWTRVVINNMLGVDDWCVLAALVGSPCEAVALPPLTLAETADCYNYDWTLLWRFVA